MRWRREHRARLILAASGVWTEPGCLCLSTCVYDPGTGRTGEAR